jgi:hypothetical protein
MNIAFRLIAACAFMLFALQKADAVEVTSNQAAVYFAGLDAPATTPAHKALQKQTKTAWDNYEKRVGQPLAAWSKQEVGYASGDTIFYPFSGPDFVTVERMYPNANRYVLVALQKALRPIYPEKMTVKHRAVFINKLGGAWGKFGQLGYFRTEDLDEEQSGKTTNLSVTAILMAFAARLNYEVQDVVPLTFNSEKTEWEPAPSSKKWSSVRLSLVKDGRKVTLDYISMNLGDDGMRASPGKKEWINRMTANPTLLKAASHLLQEPYFTILRDMIVKSAPIVVQDETGLDYKDLRKVGPVKLYGKFVKQHVLFKSTPQTELAAAYKTEKSPGELPFAFSYLKNSESRSMQIARQASLSPAQK